MMKTKNKRNYQVLKNFAIIFVPAFIIVVVLASLFINININNEKSIIKIRQMNNAHMVSLHINSIFDAINSDGSIILNSSEIKAYVNDNSKPENSNEMKRMVSNIMLNKKTYDSIRFINSNGLEAIKVNYENNSPQAVIDSNLQYKGDLSYFREGMKLNKGEIYISPMDLKVESNEVETPLKPLIRLVIPLFDENNERQGILVLNYLAQNLLNEIENDSKNTKDMKILLLNEAGHYLLSDDPSKNFSFMREDEEAVSFSKEKPDIWELIQKNNTGYFEDNGNLYYYKLIYPLENYRDTHWLLIDSASLSPLGIFANHDNKMVVMISVLLSFILAVISMILAWLLLLRKESSSREKITENIFENSKDGIIIMDSETNIIYVNRAFSQITGYSEIEAMGKKPSEFKSREKTNSIYDEVWRSVNDSGGWQGEIIDRKKDGTLYPKNLSVTKIFDNKNHLFINYLEVFEDLTNKKIAEETLNKIKYYDESTGLPTQSLFEMKMKEHIKEFDDITLIILQITNFNALYDHLGKQLGISLIKEASNRIKTFLNEKDLLAILNKDQFVIARVKSKDKLKTEHFLNKLMTFLNESIDIGAEKIYLNLSMGIAVFPEHSADIEKLIEFANIAKDYSIQTGDNTYVYYEKEIKNSYLRNLKLETHLRSALEKNELSLNYQPQVMVDTEEIIGTEALLRWNNFELGRVRPDQFISVAEKTDLIIPIGNWVLEEAIKQNKKWMELGNQKLAVAVNLSPVQFKKSDLASIIEQLLKKYALPAELLEIEITEGVLAKNMDSIRTELDKIKKLGVKVAIDDFGTGYSSLRYLQNLKFDKLKIDREFIKDYPEKDNGNIATTIINLARQMGLKVLAEGVETCEQYVFLKENGCDEIQGFYFYKPMTANEFERIIKNQKHTN